MNTTQLERCLHQFPAFGGVYARDQLENLTISTFPTALVINTGVSTGPGEHWVAVYLTGSSSEYFDSYGRKPLTEVNALFNKCHCSTVYEYNSLPLQAVGSVVCGQYCLFYLYNRIKYNTTLNNIVKHLNRYGPFVSDNYVNEFVHRYLHIRLPAYTVDNLVQQCKPYACNL